MFSSCRFFVVYTKLLVAIGFLVAAQITACAKHPVAADKTRPASPSAPPSPSATQAQVKPAALRPTPSSLAKPPVTKDAPATQPRPQPSVVVPTLAPYREPPSAQVVFFRSAKFVGSALNYDIYSDQKKIARLKNGSYFVVQVPPGKQRFYLRQSNPHLPQLASESPAEASLALQLQAGEVRYIESGVQAGFISGEAQLVLMPAEQAKPQLQRLELAAPVP
jgi:hypothetical protein